MQKPPYICSNFLIKNNFYMKETTKTALIRGGFACTGAVLAACVHVIGKVYLSKEGHKKAQDILKAKKDYCTHKCNEDIRYENAKVDAHIREQKEMNKINKEYQDMLKNDDLDGGNTKERHSKWEDFNEAVYGHNQESTAILFGGVMNMGGIHLLGGPKSSGKTILVSTLADGISTGEPFRLFPELQGSAYVQASQYVCLYDFEMSYQALAERNGRYNYKFSNICRSDKKNFTIDSWLNDVSAVINERNEDMTIILDNITRLKDDITQPIIGRRLFDGMQQLQLKAKERGSIITFVLIAHVTNNRQEYKPITLKDFAVADSLITGMDSITAISTSRNERQVLFKVLSSRHVGRQDKVAVLEIEDKPFLRFRCVGYDDEMNVLPTSRMGTESDCKKDGRKRKPLDPKKRTLAIQMREDREKGMTLKEIAEKYSVDHPTQVSRLIEGLERDKC